MGETRISGKSGEVVIGGSEAPVVVAERINPTNRKALAQDIKAGAFRVVKEEARKQSEAGANAIDINVSVPGIDEPAAMRRAVEVVQEVSDCPVVLDSPDPSALEAGLAVVKGRPLVNSVCGKEESLATVLPLVKKHGVPVVVLAMDESGIPSLAGERFAVIEKIVKRAEAEGIPLDDLVVDCLVLSAGTNQSEVMETVRAIRMVRGELGVSTILGVSNISFGLPNRGVMNATYLGMALAAGLDAVIMDPTDERMMGVVRAGAVLANRDEFAMNFIGAYRGVK